MAARPSPPQRAPPSSGAGASTPTASPPTHRLQAWSCWRRRAQWRATPPASLC